MTKRQAWCAFRVSVYDRENGATYTRDYVRGEKRMSVEGFAAFALGDLLLHTGASNNVRWRLEPIDFETVRENRLYKHTTFGSDNLPPRGAGPTESEINAALGTPKEEK